MYSTISKRYVLKSPTYCDIYKYLVNTKESVTEAKVLTLIYTHIHLVSEPPCSTTCLRLSCLLTDKFTLVIDNLWVLSELCITNRFICLYVYRIYVMCADEFVHTSGAMTDWVRDIQDPR